MSEAVYVLLDVTVKDRWSPKLFVVHKWPSERAFRQWEESAEYAP